MKSLLKRKDYAIVSGLVITTICLGTILSSTITNADPVSTTSSANASVIVSSACSMTYNTVTPHTITMTNNTTSSDVGTTTLTATCNDPSGLAIYAVGYSGDEYGNTNLIGTTGNIATGTNNATSNWSMRLYTATGSITPSSITDTFSAVPSTYTKFAELSPGTTGASALAVNATYKFYISSTQPADTYTGKVKYTMIHPATKLPQDGPMACPANKICYSPNANDTEGTMGQQTLSASSTLLASNFNRTGYGFAGWSDAYDYKTNANAHFYGPNETLSLTTSDYSTSGFSLYAVWVESEGSLQDSSKVATVCNRLTQSGPSVTPTLNSVSALTDQRDNNTYAIAKLADGKCWMIENLRLADKDENNNDIILSSSNTNNPSLPITNVYDTSNPTTSDHLSPSTNPYVTRWCYNSNAACYDQSMLNTYNFTNRASNPKTNTNSLYSYGAYYNWYSATAGHGTYSKTSGITSGDICPSGWTLPTSGSEYMHFSVLDVALGGTGSSSNSGTTPTGAIMSSRYRSYPNNFLYSGNTYSQYISDRGYYGLYWSKLVSYSDRAYNFFFDSGSVDPSQYNYKNYGLTVRCLAQ